MNGVINPEGEELVMKLLRYFIKEKNYNPIVIRGVQNEIWLENLESNYKIVRIVSNYIHNDEQFNFDMFKTKRKAKFSIAVQQVQTRKKSANKTGQCEKQDGFPVFFHKSIQPCLRSQI